MTTSSITLKARDAYFACEAADLRGLPAPFVVKAYEHRIELGVRTVDEFNTWAEALDADVQTSDRGGLDLRTVEGTLLDVPVLVFVCATDLVGSAR